MNNHKLACVLLMAVIAGIVFGAQKVRNQATEAKESAQSAKTEADAAEMQRRIAETNLIDLDKKSTSLRETYRGWVPHFTNIRSPQQGEQRIGDLVRAGDVFLLSKRFEVKEVTKDADSIIRTALKADLVFEDDYAKTLNWLGRLEEALPSCQVSHCRLTRGDRLNNIRLELTVMIPILSKAPEPEPESELASS